MTYRSVFAIAAFACAIPCAGQNTKDLVEAGRKEWLRYDSQANQAPGCEDIAPSLDSARTRTVGDFPVTVSIEAGLKRLHNQIVNCRRPLANSGSESYAKAEESFRKAYAAAPADPGVFRYLATLLADKDRWRELEVVSRDHISKAGGDPWGWMALGLALHRSGAPNAQAAFDTAAVRMNREDRARLYSFTKILARPDSIAYASAREDARADTERRFWALADPLWSRDGNDPRTEFLARASFAELRWSIDDPVVHGADSDRGEIYIRYGPPQRIIAMRGGEFGGNSLRNGLSSARTQDRGLLPGPSDVVTYWDYDNGLTVVFWGAPTFGTARFPSVDGPNIEEVIAVRASSFDNIVTERILDMPSVALRFRGPADSVDVLVIAHAPVEEMRGAIGAAAPMRADVWFLGITVPTAFRDTATVRASGVERWSFRVPPASYQYRVEVTSEGSSIAARTLAGVNASAIGDDGFAIRGFGTSDIVFASTVQPPRAVTQTPRWSDFSAAPIAGVMQKGGTFEVLWENYDVSARNGQAQYQVAVTVQRERSGTGRIAAALLGFAQNALRIDRRDDRVTSRFDRTVPAAPVIVDHVSIGLADTPAGEYRVTLEVTDTATGKKATRVTALTIRD
jgi:GWxTD domain-containing protein